MTIVVNDVIAFPSGCAGCEIQVRFRYRCGICYSVQRFQIQIYDIGFDKEQCGGCYSDPEPPLDDEDRKQLIFKIAEKILLGKALNIFAEDPPPIFNTTCIPEFQGKQSDYIEFWNPACWRTIQDDEEGYRQAFCNFDDCCIDKYSLKAIKDHPIYSGKGDWGWTIRIKDVSVIHNSNINCENYPPPMDDCSNHCNDYRLSENELIGPWKFRWWDPPKTDIIEQSNSLLLGINLKNKILTVNLNSEQIGKMKTEIYNIHGELVKSISIEKNTSGFSLNNIDFNYPDGIYFIKISVGSSIFVRKFIKY